LLILEERINHVNAKAVNAALEPEAHGIEHGACHIRIAPVQVGLFGIEEVIIGLLRLLVIRPGTTPGN
jgi:hypothetical protein